MPTETQHLEQRVAALQSDLNARDQALDDAATENNERELSRRSWFDEARRLEKECERLRDALTVYETGHALLKEERDAARAQLAERDALLLRITGSDHQDSLRAIGEAAALSASAEPAESCSVCGDLGVLPGLTVEVTKCSYCGNGWETIAKAEAELRLADQKDRDALRALLAKVRKFGWSGDDAEHIARTRAEVIAALERKQDSCEDCGDTGIEPCTKHAGTAASAIVQTWENRHE